MTHTLFFVSSQGSLYHKMYVSTDSCLWLLLWAAQSWAYFTMWCFATQAPAGQVISLDAHRWCYKMGPFCNSDGRHFGSVRVLQGACIVLHPPTRQQSHGGPTLTLFYLASTTSHVSQSGNSETTYPLPLVLPWHKKHLTFNRKWCWIYQGVWVWFYVVKPLMYEIGTWSIEEGQWTVNHVKVKGSVFVKRNTLVGSVLLNRNTW